jgi:hypothetical protein
VKIAQLAIIDLSVYRGIHTFTKNISSLDSVDTFYFNPSETNNFKSEYQSCIDISEMEIAELTNKLEGYDIVVLNLNKFIYDVDGIQKRKPEHRERLIELAKMYCQLNTITAFFDHEIYPYEGMHFNTICVPGFIKYSDYYLTYTPFFVDALKEYIGMRGTSNYTFQVGGYIDMSIYDKWIEKSWLDKKELPYISECAYYAKFKGHGNFKPIVETMNKMGLRDLSGKKLVHIGNTYSPENYFNHVKILAEHANVSRKTFSDTFLPDYDLDPTVFKVFDNHKPMILAGTYTMESMMDFLTGCRFSISTTNTQVPFFGMFITPRFEYAQIEKNLMTIPIYDKTYVDLFKGTEFSELVLSYDINDLENSLKSLILDIQRLEKDEEEYNRRRLRLIRLTRDMNKLDNFVRDMQTIVSNGKRNKDDYSEDWFNSSLEQMGYKFKPYRKTLINMNGVSSTTAQKFFNI